MTRQIKKYTKEEKTGLVARLASKICPHTLPYFTMVASKICPHTLPYFTMGSGTLLKNVYSEKYPKVNEYINALIAYLSL